MLDIVPQWLISSLVSIFATGGIAFCLIKIFGEEWIKSLYAKELEELKKAHEKELEKIKNDLNSMLNRATKLHDHEFVALPKAWRKITDAFFAVGPAINNPHIGIVPSNCSDDVLKNILRGFRVSSQEIEIVINNDNKQNTANNIIRNKQLEDANSMILEASNYITKHGIFIRPEISNEFTSLLDDLMHALVEVRDLGFSTNDKGVRNFSKEINRSGLDRLKNIEKMVRDRLWNAEIYSKKSDI